eukprot:scaffold3504_cov240-Pinguiococcus_pyrenoidosus.AAC.10
MRPLASQVRSAAQTREFLLGLLSVHGVCQHLRKDRRRFLAQSDCHGAHVWKEASAAADGPQNAHHLACLGARLRRPWRGR